MDSTLQIVNNPRLYPVAPSPTAQSIYITLPSQVIHKIVKTLAYEDRVYASTLCLVSRTFHAWVCPILYRVLRVDSARIDRWVLANGPSKFRNGLFGKSAPASVNEPPPVTTQARFEQYGLNAKTLTKFGPFVKAIIVQDKPVHIAVQILQSCVNVRDLSLWVLQGDSTPSMRRVLNSLPHLKRLSLDPTRVLGRVRHPPHFKLDQPFFRQLTHLEILHPWSSVNSLSQWTDAARNLGPSRMPNLTHLALHILEKRYFSQGLSLVQGCPQLRVVVFLGLPAAPVVLQKTPKLKAVFLRKAPLGCELLSDWERSALVGGGFWDRANAELALETNTCGTIPPPSQSSSVQESVEATSWQSVPDSVGSLGDGFG